MSTGAPALLRTKLHAPRRRAAAVPRPRLTGRLGATGQAPALTLVSAPAGFGKTTLLAEWLTGRGSTAWLSLDAGDNDPVVFWAYVVAALQTVEPAISASPSSSPEPALTSLLNQLDALEDDVVLVLDDYHVIESSTIHEQLAFLLEHLPPNVHLVIGSRADPPLPLPRLRARGELVELRAADLRFTTDEAVAYFNETAGLSLPAHDVAALEARTEGWIAALQLAALSMRGRDDIAAFIDSFTGDDRFVVDYLAEEVLERQSQAIRDFLLRTSILKRLTGPLCDAVTDGEGGAATLDALDRANLFLVALDDRRSWYRYHHLFADVLHARLLDADPGIVADLHRRASAWYEQHGDRSEAIEHALRGHDVERAAELIERAAPSMRQARQEATLRRWLSALPDDLFDARPVLLIALVGARMASGDPTGAESLLQRAEPWLGPAASKARPIVYDEEEFRRLPAQVEIYRAALALLAGDTERTRTHAQGALARIEPSDHLGRGSASALLGLAAWTLGDLDTAHDRYAGALQAFIDADYLADVLGVSLGLADIQLGQGRLGDAAHTFEAGLNLARDHPGLRGAADMHIGLSEVMLERSNLQGTADQLRAARDLGDHAGLPQYPYRWRVAAARLAHAEGDPAAALDLLDQAERVYNTDFSPSVRPIAALKARVHLAMGDIGAATRWAESRGLTANDDLRYLQEFEHVTLARIMVARREGVVLDFISRLLAAADAGGRRRSAIELLVLRAVTLDGRGDRGGAMTALEEALVRANAESYVRVFVDEGPAMAALLRRVAPHGVAGQHAQRVLAATGDAAAVAPAGHGLVEPLSSRELDVLRLLRSELSGPDIARELVVSLNTVRTHTKNIYTKLDVTNRRAAVRRADELGL